eukprot:2209910-Rhodomonas_salina.1
MVLTKTFEPGARTVPGVAVAVLARTRVPPGRRGLTATFYPGRIPTGVLTETAGAGCCRRDLPRPGTGPKLTDVGILPGKNFLRRTSQLPMNGFRPVGIPRL